MSVTAVPIAPVKRSYLVWLWIGIVVAVVAGAALAFAAPQDPNMVWLANNAQKDGVQTTASGLQYQILKKGKGATPTDEDIALVNYEGKLTDGTTFDSGQQTPMPVRAGDPDTGQPGVVEGFSEALKMMPKGSKYRFWIKPELAYGDTEQGPIPANSILEFDVDMIDFLPEAYLRQMQMMQQMQGGQPGGSQQTPAAPGGQ
ncbi:FKBP-type peptidyl-prolyl cis-trans isomerase [Stakelama sp. CBK3Z-3]|uniref:Peptidyl-prolyl cis-trans isomerase n=1 Tax=Stakelama flava TaxID=2860338 RepID=A0ABS6XJR1_9SPHN|nr:FKBP-type peptidyl-prolyl cis-trans isomerase [Stakelama flava]MBW4329685.1 FKBP-type peptidyl-prolyl cis-trans isomerase [Stakelama flava]